MQREWGGRVCRDSDGRYRWGRLRAGLDDRHVDLNPFVDECEPYGATTDFFHTHWQTYPEAVLPSGYASKKESEAADGSDLRLADQLPDEVFYLLAPNLPVSPTHFHQGPDSKDNIWEYDTVTNTWHEIPDARW